jgi:hypothetical protein
LRGRLFARRSVSRFFKARLCGGGRWVFDLVDERHGADLLDDYAFDVGFSEKAAIALIALPAIAQRDYRLALFWGA